MLQFVQAHLGAIIAAGVVGVEILLRKIPGATPIFQTISNILDQVPGLKNVTK